VTDPFAYCSATWGFTEKHTTIDQHSVTLFDVGGGNSIRGYWSRYFHEVHGLVFVVDASNAARLEEVAKVFHDVLQEPMASGKPIVVYAIMTNARMPGI
jgi:ADP-ribosylation factor-like protein 13B